MIVGGTGSFPGYHAGTDRMIRGTNFSVERAIGWLAPALQNVSASAGGIGVTDQVGDGKAPARVKRGIFRTQLHAASRHRAESAPLGIAWLHIGIRQFLCSRVSVFTNHAGIGIDQKRSIFLNVFYDDGQCGQEFAGCKSGDGAGDAVFSASM